LEQRVYAIDSVLAGISRFVLGLAKKVFLADTMAEIADKVFLLAPHELGFLNAWLGLVCFTFQIYFDFSAYSDMALGLAQAFGFDLQENFNMPYASASFTEFWRRWHISLSTWIRDYLYRPLGGNRKGKINTYFNLWVCFLLSGLWHGANWSFVVWGAYHGFFLVLEKIFGLKWQKLLPIQINRIITMFLVMLGWGIFRARDINHAHYFMRALFDPLNYYGKFIYVSNNIIFFLGLSCLVTIIQWFVVDLKTSGVSLISGYGMIYKRIAIVCILLLALGKIAVSTYNPFLYFRF
jgi:alginate O-acetyltransferase complex protein AlgI